MDDVQYSLSSKRVGWVMFSIRVGGGSGVGERLIPVKLFYVYRNIPPRMVRRGGGQFETKGMGGLTMFQRLNTRRMTI